LGRGPHLALDRDGDRDRVAPMSDGSDAPFEFDRFELVLLRWPSSPASLDDGEIDRVQQRHLDFLGEMHAAEHLVVAGPFDEQHDETLRGLCLYATGSIDETRALAAGDPAVVAGRLEVDVMYVYLKKGAIPIPWSDR
jgi:uncharacterized protein YciI